MSVDAYGYEPKSGPSNFLTLKDKGLQVSFRLVSPPVCELVVWKEGEKKPVDPAKIEALSEEQLDEVRSSVTEKGKAKYRMSEQFTWIVIDRDTGLPKFFTGTAGVYKKIKALAQNPKWGDPTKYDLSVTRTEEPGSNYYDVMSDPEKFDLTDEEIEAASKLSLSEVKPFAKTTTGVDESSEVKPKSETEPEQEAKTEDTQTVSESIDDDSADLL